MIKVDTKVPDFPILLRAFGNYPISNLDLIPQVFQKHLYILTTSDYGELDDLTKRFGRQVINTEIDKEMAIRNSGAFLNTGLERIREDGYDQVLLMASGYETSFGRVIGLLNRAINQFIRQDIIYFILPSIHFDGRLPERELDVISDISLIFPSESMAWLDLSSFKGFEPELSMKGALGSSDRGIPLGGIELMISVMKDYAQNGTIPQMTGINAPHILRGDGSPYLDEFGGIRNDRPVSVEATPNDIKRERRLLTIESACKELGLEKEGLSTLFQNTCIIGEYELAEATLNYQ
jgi:hypothetical protein